MLSMTIMRIMRTCCVAVVLASLALVSVSAASYRSAASCTSACAWSTTSTWVPTGVPVNGDNVVLTSGTIVTLSTAATNNITFESASQLTIASGGILGANSTVWGRGTIRLTFNGFWQAPTVQAGAAGIDLAVAQLDNSKRLDFLTGNVFALTINSLLVESNTLFEVAQTRGGSNLTINGNVTFLALPIAMLANATGAPLNIIVLGATRANMQSNSQIILAAGCNILYYSYGWFGPNVQGEGVDVIIPSAFRLMSGPFAWRCAAGCSFRAPAFVGPAVTFPQLLGAVTVESSALNVFSGSVFGATAFTQTGGAFGGFVSGATGSAAIKLSGVTTIADATLSSGTLTTSTITNTGHTLTLTGTTVTSGTTITGGSLAGTPIISTPLAINTFLSN